MSDQYNARRLYGRLLSYVKPYIGSFLLAVVGFIIFASAAPLMSKMMGKIVVVLEKPSVEGANFIVFALLAIFAYRGLGTFLGKYFIARVGRGVVHDLRRVLFDHMLLLPSKYYDNESSGSMISRIIFDVNQVMGATTKALTILIQEGLTVIFLMGYLIYLDWTLTLVFLGLVPCIGVLVGLASRYFRKYSQRIQKSMGDVTQVTNEAVNGFREVRTFGGNEFESQRFLKASEDNRRQALKFELTNAISVPLIQQIVAAGLGVMVYMMFDRVIAGEMTSEEFMTFITAASLIAKPIRAITNINSTVQKGLVGAHSIFTVMDSDIEENKGVAILSKVKGDIKIRDLYYRYETSEDWILKGLTADVEAGKSYALVGKSGSGKTTFVNLLPRFYNHQQGVISLDGHNINDIELTSLRSSISIVSQNVTLFNASIRDNIAYGELSDRTDEQVIMAAKAAHAHEFIENMSEGYRTIIGDDGVLLSGGQRQRLAIARAILKDAPVLILDEATSALDTESERHIQAAMEEVMKGRTTFVIAHRLSTIESADQIWVMEQGEIVEKGSHQQLLEKDGAYALLHKMQFSEGEA